MLFSIVLLFWLSVALNGPSIHAARQRWNHWNLVKKVKTESANLRKLEAKVTKLDTSLQELRSEQAAAGHDLQDLRISMNGRFRDLQRDQTAQQVATSRLETSLKELKLTGFKQQIAFTARSTRSPVILSPGHPIKFEYIASKVGTGFNRITGIFKAPVAGLYVFYAQMMNDAHYHKIQYAIEKAGANANTETILCRNALWNQRYEASSCLATVHLRVDDQVFVKKVDDPMATGTRVFGEWSSSFSGVLIAAD